MAQTIKCLPTMQETRVQSLGWEDLLEKEIATHSSILVWKIPWMKEPDGLQSMGWVTKSWTRLSDFTFSLSCIGEGNGNPLQCSCLENPRDGGAWWAAVYGVAQSRTRLKRLSSSSSSVHICPSQSANLSPRPQFALFRTLLQSSRSSVPCMKQVLSR